MAEAPHGTAPTLQGKNVANPLAMILAGASVLPYMQDEHASVVSRAIYEGALEAVAEEAKRATNAGWFTFVMGDGKGSLLNVEGYQVAMYAGAGLLLIGLVLHVLFIRKQDVASIDVTVAPVPH